MRLSVGIRQYVASSIIISLEAHASNYNLLAGSSNQFLCDMVVDLCYSSPCRNNGSCVAREGGYICVCPADRTGTYRVVAQWQFSFHLV